MKRLTLSLKKKWFDLIKSGVKLEEYREIKPYWIERFKERRESLGNNCGVLHLKHFDKITFTCGYPKSDEIDKRITFDNPHIRIDSGKEEWGAEKGTLYFVISWEK